ncbi:MAG: pitrilysin family protein [Pelovirga sp.]
MRYFLGLQCLALLCVAASAFAEPVKHPGDIDFPPLELEFPSISEHRTTHGMRIYLKEDDELPLVNISVMVRGGSIQDPLDKAGLSELFAQTLETGGAGELSPQVLEEELDRMAAQLTVTSSTYSYQVDLSIHQRDLQRGLEILTGLLRQPAFDGARFELARQRLLQAIHRRNDNPADIAGRYLAAAVNPGHPLAAEPTEAGINSITIADLEALHERFFRPARLWWAVSGDIDEQSLLEQIERLFGDWQADAVALAELPPLPAATTGRAYLVDKKLPQTTILLGHRGISKDNPDMLAVRVANHILGGGGFNSRLMREIRSNRGLAYSIYSQLQPGRHLPELFFISGETKNETAVEVVELALQIIREMIDQPVSAAELDLARNSLVNSFIFAFEHTHAVVTQKVRLDFYDYPADYLQSYQSRLKALTVADIQRVARTYFDPAALQVVLVGDSTIYATALAERGYDVEMIDLDQEPNR